LSGADIGRRGWHRFADLPIGGRDAPSQLWAAGASPRRRSGWQARTRALLCNMFTVAGRDGGNRSAGAQDLFSWRQRRRANEDGDLRPSGWHRSGHFFSGKKAMTARTSAILCILIATPALGLERFAIAIGNNVGSGSRASLWFAERDAERFARTLS